MKAGWKTVKLGEACKIVNGATPSTSVEANWGGPHCWITPAEMGGFSDPYVGETRRTLTDVGLADCSASLLPAGSVILSSRAPIGHVILNMVPMATNQGCKSMIPRSDLDAKFLFYFIKANVPLLESLGTGATFKELSGGKLASVEIPLPPLAEQKRIVALLDEAFAGIDEAKANTEEKLRGGEALAESYLEKVFSEHTAEWCEKTLGQICVVDWGNTDLTKSSYVKGGKFLAVSAAGCDGRIGHMEHVKHTPVLSAIGAQCGRMFLPEENFTAIKNTITLTPLEGGCSGKFLYRLLTHVELPKRGAAQPFIAKGDIVKFKVSFPKDIQTQTAIAQALDLFEAESRQLSEICEKQKTALNELQKSILSRAFTGELTA